MNRLVFICCPATARTSGRRHQSNNAGKPGQGYVGLGHSRILSVSALSAIDRPGGGNPPGQRRPPAGDRTIEKHLEPAAQRYTMPSRVDHAPDRRRGPGQDVPDRRARARACGAPSAGSVRRRHREVRALDGVSLLHRSRASWSATSAPTAPASPPPSRCWPASWCPTAAAARCWAACPGSSGSSTWPASAWCSGSARSCGGTCR